MRQWKFLFSGFLLVIGGCTEPSGSAGAGPAEPAPAATTLAEVPTAPALPEGRVACMAELPEHDKAGKARLFREHAAHVKAALGDFDDITVHEWNEHDKEWKLVSGQYIPVTVDGKQPAPYEYQKEMRSDRPMMLPTRVQGFQGGDGQSNPYSVVGRMPGTNPEVQWIFVVRQYSIKKPSDPDFDQAGDIAVIGHHPRTGATAFFQYYDPGHPKTAKVVYSISSEQAPDFWSPIDKLAAEFRCERCHSNDAFIHTPWANQVRANETAPGQPLGEAMVPSSPLGPYFFIDSGPGERFECWNYALQHLESPQNQCTTCHRVTPYELAGLGENSTRYQGLEFDQRNQFSLTSDLYQTDTYYNLTWMPAIDMVDFYAGQPTDRTEWEHDYGPSAATVNQMTRAGLPVVSDDCREPDPKCAPLPKLPGLTAVPRPPQEYQTIIVDRPEQDTIAANRSLWLVDTRMRANTDGALDQWRYFAKAAGGGMTAAPVVYRRLPGDGGQLEFRVVFIGAASSGQQNEAWLPVSADGTTFAVKQGDYFGLALSNAGSDSGAALIPYTEDDWARLKAADGTTRFYDGEVVYYAVLDQAPSVGEPVRFRDADYRTYSFELLNKL